MIYIVNQFMVYGLWFMVLAISLSTINYKLTTRATGGRV